MNQIFELFREKFCHLRICRSKTKCATHKAKRTNVPVKNYIYATKYDYYQSVKPNFPHQKSAPNEKDPCSTELTYQEVFKNPSNLGC